MSTPRDIIIAVSEVEAKLNNLKKPTENHIWINRNGRYEQMHYEQYAKLLGQNEHPHMKLIDQANKTVRAERDYFNLLPTAPTDYSWDLQNDRWVLLTPKQLKLARKHRKSEKSRPLHKKLQYLAGEKPEKHLKKYVLHCVEQGLPVKPKKLPIGYRKNNYH